MKDLIIVRGGGDLATATIHRLWRAGYRVLVLETQKPSSIRRQVSISEAVYDGCAEVEGMKAVLINGVAETENAWHMGYVPVMLDADAQCVRKLHPEILIDAIVAKRNLGTYKNMAPMTIALGPGFAAGRDVHAVIETMRGHNLGRIIFEGSAQPNTGIPGSIGGYAAERVIHAHKTGIIHVIHSIGESVERGEIIAHICNDGGEYPVYAPITGLIRGMIRDGYHVTSGFKIADIDPRSEEYGNCFTISDKARCIAGSVLELVCRHFASAEDNRERGF